MSGLSNKHADDALREPTYFKLPPFHPFRPDTEGLVDNACGVLAFPFPKERHNVNGGRDTIHGPYQSGTSGWAQINCRFQFHDQFARMLHLLTMALGMKNNGCPVFKETRKKRACQMAYLRHVEGRATKEDKIMLSDKSLCRQALFMDQRVSEMIRAITSGAFNDRIPGREDRPPEGEDEILDGADVNIDDRREMRRSRAGRRENDEEGGDDDDDLDPLEEIDLAILGILDEGLQETEGKFVMEKLQILVVNMTRPALDDDGMVAMENVPGQRVAQPIMEDAGCVVFVLVMDPFYSVGKSFRELIEMAEEHRKIVLGTGAEDDGDNRVQDGDHGHGGGGGGGGKKRFRPTANQTRLMEHFPYLNEPGHKDNTMHNMTMEKYLDLVSFIRNDEAMSREDKQRHLARGMDHPGTAADPNKLHPLNVFTPEFALRIMANFGVEAEQCHMEVFRGEDYLFDALNDEGGPGVARWKFPPEMTWHYELAAWKWHLNAYAALREQYWPWINVPNAMKELTAIRNDNNAMTLYEGDSHTNVISREWARSHMQVGMGVIVALPEMPYDPNAMIRQSAIFQASMQHQRVLATVIAPRDPENMPDDYALYCTKMAEMRDACMRRMQQILVPSERVAPGFNLIFTFMAQKVRKVGTFLPQHTMDPFDPRPRVMELDPFANYMLREALYVRYFRFIVAEVRHWQITHHGSCDAYSLMNVDMHYSTIFRGISQSGKSFFAKDATVKTLVPGTVSQMLESSNRAFNTHDDFTATIIFKDEIDNIYVDAKAAESDKSGAAERIKSMMTDQKCTYRVLVFLDQANGRQRRVAEDIESLYHATMICCTNKRVDGSDEAIASRFLNFVITRAEADLFDYLGINDRLSDLDKQRNDDFVHMLRVKQCLLAMSQALIDSGVLPEPSMDVYDTLNARLMSYMKEQGLDTSAIRGAQMTKRLARVYVILNAIIQLYDVPGAKYGKKDFELRQLADLLPYLFCTKQIFLFALTQTGEVYVHPMQMIVLTSICRLAGFEFNKTKTIEQHFKGDLQKKLPWKINHIGDAEKEVIDLNYIRIEGEFKSKLVKAIAENSRPRIGENDAESEIIALTRQYITTKPLELVSGAYYASLKEHEIGALNLPRKPTFERLPLIVREYKSGFLYMATDALKHYRDDLIIEAFLHCIHDGFRPQIFLLGMQLTGPHPIEARTEFTYTGIYRTLAVNQITIEQYSMGKNFMAQDTAFMAPLVQQVLAGPRLHADKQREKYEQSGVKRSKAVMEISEDLDDWGYRQHHYRSAIPGHYSDGPGMQMAIFNKMRDKLERIERRHDANDRLDLNEKKNISYDRSVMLDYPGELRLAEDSRLQSIKTAKNFSETRARRLEMFNQTKARWNKMTPQEKAQHTAPREPTAADFMDGGRFHVVTENMYLLPAPAPADSNSEVALIPPPLVSVSEAPESLANRRKARRRDLTLATLPPPSNAMEIIRSSHNLIPRAPVVPPAPRLGRTEQLLLEQQQQGVVEYMSLDLEDDNATRNALVSLSSSATAALKNKVSVGPPKKKQQTISKSAQLRLPYGSGFDE